MSAMHEFADTNVVLLGRTSLAVLVPPGTTTIFPDPRAEGPSCGLIPLAGPARVTTSGLKWNLDDDEMTFGRFISTSNEFATTTTTTTTTTTVTTEAATEEGDEEEEEEEEGGMEKTKEKEKEDGDDGGVGDERLRVVITTDKPLVWTTDISRLRDVFFSYL